MKVTPLAEQQISEILSDPSNAGKSLRVGIKGSGCAGFQYGFSVDDIREDDIVIGLCNGDYKIVIDPISLAYVNEATLDFKDDPFLKTFVLDNPAAKTTCGCGTSFSV